MGASVSYKAALRMRKLVIISRVTRKTYIVLRLLLLLFCACFQLLHLLYVKMFPLSSSKFPELVSGMKDVLSTNTTTSAFKDNATSNATALASASVGNAFVSLSCLCNSTGSWCRGVANASNATAWVSARANVSCRFNVAQFVQNTTHLLAPYVRSNYNRVIYILTLAICSLFLMVSLICLSPLRRHSRNKFLASVLWASQALPFTVIAHTLGLMQSPPYDNEAYAIWVALCLLIHGISSSSVYGLHDPRQEKKQIFQEGMLLYLATWSIYLHLPGKELGYLRLPRKELGSKLQPPEKVFPNLQPAEKELRGLEEEERGKLLLAVAVLSILLAVALKFLFRLLQTCLAYSRGCRLFGLRRRMKLVADYMSVDSPDSSDPITKTGYNYLVKGEENVVELMASKEDCRENSIKISEKIVTVERIWKCNGGLLRGKEGEELKDKCLSFALFRLLAMRLGGFQLRKNLLSKTWRLMRDGLLSEQNEHERELFSKQNKDESSKPNKYKRIFRVVEDELSFLYDYFYTQYPLLFSDGMFFAARTAIYAFLELAQVLAGLSIAVLLSKELTLDKELYGFCRAENRIWSPFLHFDCKHVTDKIHFLGACIFVLVYVILQILQLRIIVSSNWTKVWVICEYVGRPRWQGNKTWERLLGFVCGPELIPLKPWRRKMEQYSLLSSYDYRPIFYFLTSALSALPNRGQEIQDSKKLDQDVEGAVIDALKDNDLQSTNAFSLERKIDSQLCWACRLEWIAERILVWHVATSFCALHRKYGGRTKGKKSACECFSRWYCTHLLDCGGCKEEESANVKQKREVAECLSGYCAYLVAFVPALLPDPIDSAEVVFDQAILNARQVLTKCRGLWDVYDELWKVGTEGLKSLEKNEADKGIQEVEAGGFGEKVAPGLKRENEEAPMDLKILRKPVVVKGAIIGMQLLSYAGDNEERLWQVLVDFWAEMMLFLASNNKQKAHIESLVNGGEFITHLWALLIHVGGCRQESNESVDPIANSDQGGFQSLDDQQPMDGGTNDSLGY